MDWFTINPKLMRHLTDIAAWSDPATVVSSVHSPLIFRPVQVEDVDLIV
jgi:hypothetical protein